MTRETLIKARNILTKSLKETNEIDIINKIELETFLWLVFNYEEYIKMDHSLQKSINNGRK